MSSARILLVEDDRALALLLKLELSKSGHEVTCVLSGEAALAEMDTSSFDVVVSDLLLLGELTGTQLCTAVHDKDPEIPVVLMSAHGTLDVAIEALRASAWDFVVKPFAPEVLALAVARALKHRELHREVKNLRAALSQSSTRGTSDIVGQSPKLRAALELVARVANTDVSVLIRGASGSGKELVARALHDGSKRRARPFVAVNCAAVPEALLESQLFGHVRGAFTDAKADRKGLFVQADGGTIFLDEIGDMPLALQPKILRALQERRVLPVGADVEVAFDARVVAATHRNLKERIEQGLFREDLYYRLDVVDVVLPTLAERGSDVLLLAQHFLTVFAKRMGKAVDGLSQSAATKLLDYDWPGNVRELMNCLERAVALTQTSQIVVDDLPDRVRDHRPRRLVLDFDPSGSLVLPLDEVERRYIMRVLEVVGGQKKKAAELLGIDRKTLYRKLVEFGVEDDGPQQPS